MKNQCKICKNRYKVLTPEGLCYHCHIYKYKDTPKTGCYEEGKKK